jgi:maltooligosyltrehalose trehalohydrolase
MVKAFSEGFVYSGSYSETNRRRHGNSSYEIPPLQFVVFAQNHDQIGNRMMGERLGQLVGFEAYKLAAGVVLLSPFLPLLFMGDEYGEIAPFQYFVSHSHFELIEAVRRGRQEEFASFTWTGDPPDPQDEQTFLRSKLNHRLKKDGSHRVLLAYHEELLRLRKSLPALRCLSKEAMDVVGFDDECVLVVRRWNGTDEVLVIFSFNDGEVGGFRNIPAGPWRKKFDSTDVRWLGNGMTAADTIKSWPRDGLMLQPHSVLVFEKEVED